MDEEVLTSLALALILGNRRRKEPNGVQTGILKAVTISHEFSKRNEKNHNNTTVDCKYHQLPHHCAPFL
jgi:hypothetical protein